jgi:hypothetical protein
MAKCILCEQECERHHPQGMDGYEVECQTCGRYFLASPEIFEAAYIKMPREKRSMISAYTRELFEQGKERPELGDDDLLASVIEEYENKTDDQRLENLILFLRKRSKEFGVAVDINEARDYPITYSLSKDGFSAILKVAKDRGLLEEGTAGLGGRLTEEGWKMGTRVMKASRA